MRLYLNWHCEQVGTQEEEPHQLVGVYGNEVADLPHCHSPHGHVGGAETHYFIEDLRLEVKPDMIFAVLGVTQYKLRDQITLSIRTDRLRCIELFMHFLT